MNYNQRKKEICKAGRLTLPDEFCNVARIRKGSLVEFFINDDNALIIRRFGPKCVFCGRMGELRAYKGKKVCVECIIDIKKRHA